MKTILAPIDFSDVTEAVVAETARLALAMKARVVLFNAVQPPAILSEYAGLIDNIADIMSVSERAAQQKLAKLAEKLRRQSITVKEILEVGEPTALIVRQAAKCAADYIILGSHGHTALFDLLVGSTAHSVLIRSTCPVVVVPSPTRPVRG